MSDKIEVAEAGNKSSLDLFMEIKIKLEKLSIEQMHIIKQLTSLEERRTKDVEEVKKLQEKINEMAQYSEFKSRIRNSVMQWLRISPILIMLLMGIVGYIAYEVGLYKPVPTYNTDKK